MNQTEKRKLEHVERALDSKAQYKKRTLLEDIELVHCALPELDYNNVSLDCNAFGKKFSMPLMITAMTGGFSNAKKINEELAKAAEKFNIPLGLGSQRAMIESSALKETYDVKKCAKGAFLVGNIGAFQLKKYSIKQIDFMIKGIDADALAIHLNPLQEIIQPEGDTNWENVSEKIKDLSSEIGLPVIVKETGAGISSETAIKLKELGIKWVDIAGSGGTSWSKIEYMRGGKIPGFEEWGIPTAISILMCREKASVIASGGIRNGIDGAKALALGAKMFGAAVPFLHALKKKKLEEEIKIWKEQLRTAMFLTGCKNIEALQQKKAFYAKGELLQIANSLNIKI